jgi:hypothetical protein
VLIYNYFQSYEDCVCCTWPFDVYHKIGYERATYEHPAANREENIGITVIPPYWPPVIPFYSREAIPLPEPAASYELALKKGRDPGPTRAVN